MSKTVKRKLSSGKNKLGKKKDGVRLQWEWIQRSPPIYLKTIAKIGHFTLIVYRWTRGWSNSPIDKYSFAVTLDNKGNNSIYYNNHHAIGHLSSEEIEQTFHEITVISRHHNTYYPTRIDAQIAAEKAITEYLGGLMLELRKQR